MTFGAKVGGVASLKKFEDYVRSERRAGRDITIFRLEADFEIPVELEQVAEIPGRYVVRYGDEDLMTTAVGQDAIMRHQGADVIAAKGMTRATTTVLDSLNMQIRTLMEELESERKRSRRMQDDNDDLRNDVHTLKDRIRDMTVEAEAGSDEMLTLMRDMFMAYQQSDFRQTLISRFRMLTQSGRIDQTKAEELGHLLNEPEFMSMPIEPANSH